MFCISCSKLALKEQQHLCISCPRLANYKISLYCIFCSTTKKICEVCGKPVKQNNGQDNKEKLIEQTSQIHPRGHNSGGCKTCGGR